MNLDQQARELSQATVNSFSSARWFLEHLEQVVADETARTALIDIYRTNGDVAYDAIFAMDNVMRDSAPDIPELIRPKVQPTMPTPQPQDIGLTTFINEYGEKKYRITETVRKMSTLAIAAALRGGERGFEASQRMTEAVTGHGDDDIVSVDLYVTEAAALSAALDELK